MQIKTNTTSFQAKLNITGCLDGLSKNEIQMLKNKALKMGNNKDTITINLSKGKWGMEEVTCHNGYTDGGFTYDRIIECVKNFLNKETKYENVAEYVAGDLMGKGIHNSIIVSKLTNRITPYKMLDYFLDNM